MTFRTFAACALAVAGLAVAGCGDDEEPSSNGGTTTAENSTSANLEDIKDIEPRASKPNIVGGSGPIDEFLTTVGNDAIAYWGKVFEASDIPYQPPTINVLTTPGDNGCGEEFDPTKRPFFLCLSGEGSTISLGAPLLDRVRNAAGDAGVGFLAGYAVAVDTVDQLLDRPLAKGAELDQEFAALSACFTGSWIRNLNDRELLEAGDDQEVLKMAELFIGEDVGADAVALGFNEGAAGCIGGGSGGEDEGGGGEDEGGTEPAPSE
jgi:predicted metalloprotease